MRKIAVTVISLFAFSVGTGFAAPINNLTQGQSAIGIVDNSLYLEHKLSDRLLLGCKRTIFMDSILSIIILERLLAVKIIIQIPAST